MKFRFTLRDWLWLVLVVAILLISVMDHWHSAQQMARLQERLKRIEYLEVMRSTGDTITSGSFMELLGGTDDAQRTDGPSGNQ